MPSQPGGDSAQDAVRAEHDDDVEPFDIGAVGLGDQPGNFLSRCRPQNRRRATQDDGDLFGIGAVSLDVVPVRHRRVVERIDGCGHIAGSCEFAGAGPSQTGRVGAVGDRRTDLTGRPVTTTGTVSRLLDDRLLRLGAILARIACDLVARAFVGRIAALVVGRLLVPSSIGPASTAESEPPTPPFQSSRKPMRTAMAISAPPRSCVAGRAAKGRVRRGVAQKRSSLKNSCSRQHRPSGADLPYPRRFSGPGGAAAAYLTEIPVVPVIARVAQLVEQLSCKQQVAVGSCRSLSSWSRLGDG